MRNSQSVIDNRQARLLRYIQTNKSINVTEMSQILSCSPLTIRRDLEQLSVSGLVQRHFGGASLVPRGEETEEPARLTRGDPHTAQKLAIAQQAASLLCSGDTVFINSSSTAMLVLQFLKGIDILIITNNGRSLTMPRCAGVELMLTGGEVYGNKHSLVGEFALSALNKVTATKCILGVSGISVAGGITSRVSQETAINHKMLVRCSGPKIIVADSRKIGAQHNFFSGSVQDVTHLITNDQADHHELDALRKAGLEVITVSTNEYSNIL